MAPRLAAARFPGKGGPLTEHGLYRGGSGGSSSSAQSVSSRYPNPAGGRAHQQAGGSATGGSDSVHNLNAVAGGRCLAHRTIGNEIASLAVTSL